MDDYETPAATACAGLDPGRTAVAVRRRIGAILVERGLLGLHDAERVAALQDEHGLRFGEMAVSLGLVAETDLQQALAHQFRYPCLAQGDQALDPAVLAAFEPFTPQVEDLRTLRCQLLLRWPGASTGRKALAVVSGGSGEGRSHVVANLAVVFAQSGQRTLVIDADLRRPCQHRLFRLPNQRGLSDLLAGHAAVQAVATISSLPRLSVLCAGPTPPDPQGLLGSDKFPALLQMLCASFDIILLDTPASARFADAHLVSKHAGAALLLTREHISSLAGAGELARTLQEQGTTVLGSILNRG